MRAMARKARQRITAPSRRRRNDRDLATQVKRLEKRVDVLETKLRARLREVENGLQEQRALGQRVAVLGDLVAEVVSAAARGDRDDLDAALTRYSDGL